MGGVATRTGGSSLSGGRRIDGRHNRRAGNSLHPASRAFTSYTTHTHAFPTPRHPACSTRFNGAYTGRRRAHTALHTHLNFKQRCCAGRRAVCRLQHHAHAPRLLRSTFLRPAAFCPIPSAPKRQTAALRRTPSLLAWLCRLNLCNASTLRRASCHAYHDARGVGVAAPLSLRAAHPHVCGGRRARQAIYTSGHVVLTAAGDTLHGLPPEHYLDINSIASPLHRANHCVWADMDKNGRGTSRTHASLNGASMAAGSLAWDDRTPLPHHLALLPFLAYR